MRTPGLFLAASLALFLWGCGGETRKDETPSSRRPSAPTNEPVTLEPPTAQSPPTAAKKAPAPPRKIDTAFWYSRNRRIDEWVATYTKNRLPLVLLDRARPFFPEVRRIVASYGLPNEISLLPLVESGYDPRAKSRTTAVGLWQFTVPTAREYGLVVSGGTDERLDWRKSTHAACRYLGRLNEHFGGDWALTIASYNAGPGEMDRAVASQGTGDYWSLRLREEPANYVPKYLAMIRVIREAKPRL